MPDLHLTEDRATDAETAAIDAAIAAVGVDPAIVFEADRLVRGGVHRKHDRRHALLPALHALQNTSGWISPGGLNHIAEVLGVPPAEGYGVASFYELFRVDSAPDHDESVIHVCVDSPCLATAEAKIAALEAEGKHVHRSPCLGQCERGSTDAAVFIQGRNGPDSVPADQPDELWELPQRGEPQLKLLRNIGRIDPTSIEAYIGAGGFTALAAAFEMGADKVISEVTESGLMGRGGAAFPTGVKWRGVAEAEGPQKYVVANADESEPGTFKDRTIMENDPFSLIEAMTIAGFATGATKGFIYIRGEYPLATTRLQVAIDASRDAGFLGSGIARSSVDFDIEIRRGAGAYICGEETALFASLEGFRGEPRQKPPFPTTNGLFDAPTAINNPETLLNVLPIMLEGGAAYGGLGTERSSGHKLFCLSGAVARPGTYEVEFGPTLREIIDLAGGATGEIAAVLMGGAAGSFVGPDALDMPLTMEAVREAGTTLGSGVVMVFDTDTDFDAVCIRLAEFFRNESCGQCVPCRVGAVRQHELLVRAADAAPKMVLNGEVQLLAEMDLAMKDASICGLGHTASTAVRSAIDLGLIGSPS